jgi:hypothetical protein
MTKRIAELEVKRTRLHEYIIMKLEERDYHAVQDAGSDLRELEVESKILIKLRLEEDARRAALGIPAGVEL